MRCSHELNDVAAEFATFEKTDLAKLNDALKAKNMDPIEVPAAAPDELRRAAAGRSRRSASRIRSSAIENATPGGREKSFRRAK